MKKSERQKRREAKAKRKKVIIDSPIPTKTEAVKEAEKTTNPNTQENEEQRTKQARFQGKANRMTLVLALVCTLLFAVAIGFAFKDGSLTRVFWSWVAVVMLGILAIAFYIQAYVIGPKEAAKIAVAPSPEVKRPRIAVVTAAIQLEVGKPLILVVQFHNVGDIPAHVTRAELGPYFVDANSVSADQCPEPVRKGEMGIFSKLVASIGRPQNSVWTSPEIYTAEMVGHIREDRVWFYIWWKCLYYGDRPEDGEYYSEYFVRYYPATNAFALCQNHNDAN